jgi:hypothetical protein
MIASLSRPDPDLSKHIQHWWIPMSQLLMQPFEKLAKSCLFALFLYAMVIKTLGFLEKQLSFRFYLILIMFIKYFNAWIWWKLNFRETIKIRSFCLFSRKLTLPTSAYFWDVGSRIFLCILLRAHSLKWSNKARSSFNGIILAQKHIKQNITIDTLPNEGRNVVLQVVEPTPQTVFNAATSWRLNNLSNLK